MWSYGLIGTGGYGRPEALVKGTLVVTLKKFLLSRGVDPRYVVARLPEADRDALLGIVLPSGWYSAAMFERFVDAVRATVSNGDDRECLLAMGRFSAETNLGPGGLRRAYIHDGDPHHVLSAVGHIYRTVYTVGHRTYERTGDHSAIVRGHGTHLAHDHCVWVAGWLQRVVELSGGREVRVVETQCERARAPNCEYQLTWA